MEIDFCGRYIMLYLEIDKKGFQIINLYVPNKDDRQFFADFIKDIDIVGNVIIGGDFNTYLSQQNIKGGKGNHHPKATAMLLQLIEQYDLVDIWRVRHPSTFMHTWMRKSPLLYKRLDYLLVSAADKPVIINTGIDPAVLSDHSIPWIEYQTDSDLQRGKGYWKLNTSFLEDTDYCNQTIKIIEQATKEYQDPILRLEMIKINARGFTIQYATRKKKSRENKVAALERKLKDIVDEQCKSNLFNMQLQNRQVYLITKDLEDLLAERTKGAMLQSQSTWFDHGEKQTSYFLQLEINRARCKAINRLYDQQGNLRDTQQEINEVIHSYYSKLFSSQNLQQDPEYLNDITLPTLDDTDQAILDAPINIEEIKIAVKSLNKDKCPGCDSFPIEWYEKFLPHLIYTLHSVYLRNIELGCIHGSARESIISLMDEVDKDNLYLEHWRPLSLLTSDYKIYTKVLASRLQMVLDKLLSTDQRGFIRQRKMTDNLLELRLVIDYCQKINQPAVVSFIDFRKAFDTLEWPAIQSIMYKYGFTF